LIYNKIELLRKKKKISKTEFYEAIGMSNNGFLQMVENNSMKITTLQKIADVLGVPVSIFFEDGEQVDLPDAGAFDLESFPDLRTESIADALKRYEGLTDREIIVMLMQQIGVLRLQVEMLTHLAHLRLQKIKKLQEGQGAA
jgi:transcriptional regulator with XRE-family HTH domain